MRIAIIAVGRCRAGPEHELVADYVSRAARVGRPLGLGQIGVREIDDRRARGPNEQGALLLDAIPSGSAVLVLDERGKAITSPAFADLLAGMRDSGRADAAFLIGGADGHGDAVRARADRLLSLGPMVWPHMLVRAMLAEQIYRSLSILAGTPYHRA